VRRGEKSEEHRDFLTELNCSLRGMCEELIKAINQQQQANLVAEANRVIQILDISLVMVSQEGPYPDSKLEVMVEQIKNNMTSKDVETLKARHPRQRLSSDQLPKLLQEGKDAINVGNKARCGELGELILTNFGRDMFLRAVGITLAYDGTEEHREWAYDLKAESPEVNSLETENKNEFLESTRQFWLDAYSRNSDGIALEEIDLEELELGDSDEEQDEEQNQQKALIEKDISTSNESGSLDPASWTLLPGKKAAGKSQTISATCLKRENVTKSSSPMSSFLDKHFLPWFR